MSSLREPALRNRIGWIHTCLDLEQEFGQADWSSEPERRIRPLIESFGFDAAEVSIEFCRPSRSAADVRIFLQAAATGRRGALQALERELLDSEMFESVRLKGATYSCRIRTELISSWTAEWLPGRGADGSWRVAALPHQKIVVNFLNPNATKPLHLGHLRNIALGNAIASLFEWAGAEVVRQAYIGDVGRSMSEAMAGYRSLPANSSPEESNRKSDQFVGECYAGYVRQHPDEPGAESEDPIHRETVWGGDEADELMQAWLNGEPEVHELWKRIRTWALDGQQATLERLGISFDQLHFESDAMPKAKALAERGLELGVFQEDEIGAVLYPTGRAQYPNLVMIREDGFPTEHARLICLFLNEEVRNPHANQWISILGDEWDAAEDLHGEIMERFGDSNLVDRVLTLCYGMVNFEGARLKSRDGKALLVDDFLDYLQDASEVQDFAQRHHRLIELGSIVDVLTKSFILACKPSKSIEFRWEALLDRNQNMGWPILDAWGRAETFANQEGSAEAIDPEALRKLRLQHFRLHGICHSSLQNYDPSSLVKFSAGLSNWFLDQEACPALSREFRVLLLRALTCLGMSVDGRA